jgi:hypothetical protein
MFAVLAVIEVVIDKLLAVREPVADTFPVAVMPRVPRVPRFAAPAARVPFVVRDVLNVPVAA